jgi:hypothetical protein
MKYLICLASVLALLGITGCVWERDDGRGGYGPGYHHGYGYDHGYDHDHDHYDAYPRREYP